MIVRALTTTAGILALLGVGLPAAAQDSPSSPGLQALEHFREGGQPTQAIENRFFLKEGRFEITPMVGYVPNNPFASRYVGGVLVSYHFNEAFGAQAQLSYAPDLGESDLKSLTRALVHIAHSGPGGTGFQQPLDKTTLGASFGALWTPVYGKINLIGETVLNFDLYGTAGLGILSRRHYYAVFDASAGGDNVALRAGSAAVNLTPSAGLGMNFFLNQTVALKIDGRFNFYVDDVPTYCDDPGRPECQPSGQRLYNTFTISSGLSFYFPRMQPRLYDF